MDGFVLMGPERCDGMNCLAAAGLSIEDIWIMFKQRAEDKSAAIENSHPSKSAASGKSV